VSLLRLALLQDLAAGELFVRGPRVRVTATRGLFAADESPHPSAGEGGPPSSPARRLEELAQQLPVLRFGRLSVEDARLEVYSDAGGRAASAVTLFESIEGLTIDCDEVRVDPNAPRDPKRVAYSDDVRVKVERFHARLDGGRYELVLGPIAGSTRDSSLRVHNLAYRPTSSKAAYLQERGPRRDRLSLEVSVATIEGFDYWCLIEQLELAVQKLTLERLQVDVLSDKHKPPQPRRGRPRMPHDLFQDLKTRLRVEEIELRDGDVCFSQRAADGSEPGTISFSGINGHIFNVTNDPTRMRDQSPAQLKIRALLQEVAAIDLEARMPLLRPGPTVTYKARVDAFDARILNGILTPLEGVRILSGSVGGVALHIVLCERRATGSVSATYRDNVPAAGKQLRVGRVDYAVGQNDGFFRSFWNAVRDGLLDLVQR